MKDTALLLAQVQDGALDSAFAKLYPRAGIDHCRRRYTAALEAFVQRFGPDRPAVLVSAPGRTEVGGNHTDHQRGRVLAASVDLDVLCVASPNGEMVARVHSQGHPPAEVDLGRLSVQPEDRESDAGLIRGIAAWFAQQGQPVGGFDAYTTSEVLVGSGLSSSAAFEVALGNILKALYGGELDAVAIARAGQYAENVHFGKPSGLMDQMASSVGGLVLIDFADPACPVVEPMALDLAAAGLALCIVDTGGSHANLTADYAAIPAEMGEVARFFGKEQLREVDPATLGGHMAALRIAAGDRAVLRALHFFGENQRVSRLAQAVREGETDRFLALVTESGRSSQNLLQNVFSPGNPREQGLSLALALSEEMLGPVGGAWRVHGGGFAGTIQAFVPQPLLEDYCRTMDGVFGEGRCHVLSVRPVGGVQVLPE